MLLYREVIRYSLRFNLFISLAGIVLTSALQNNYTHTDPEVAHLNIKVNASPYQSSLLGSGLLQQKESPGKLDSEDGGGGLDA